MSSNSSSRSIRTKRGQASGKFSEKIITQTRTKTQRETEMRAHNEKNDLDLARNKENDENNSAGSGNPVARIRRKWEKQTKAQHCVA